MTGWYRTTIVKVSSSRPVAGAAFIGPAEAPPAALEAEADNEVEGDNQAAAAEEDDDGSSSSVSISSAPPKGTSTEAGDQDEGGDQEASAEEDDDDDSSSGSISSAPSQDTDSQTDPVSFWLAPQVAASLYRCTKS